MLTDIDLDSIQYLAHNLRDEDKAEIFSLLEYGPEETYRFGWEAFVLFRNKGRAAIAWHQGRPAALIGITEMRRGVWEISMFGTNEFRNVAFECARWAKRTIPDLIENHGGRRLQCDSQLSHETAHRFLKALGARPEGPPMRWYGKDGSAYQRFVWLFNENGFVTKNGNAVGELSKGDADVLRV